MACAALLSSQTYLGPDSLLRPLQPSAKQAAYILLGGGGHLVCHLFLGSRAQIWLKAGPSGGKAKSPASELSY